MDEMMIFWLMVLLITLVIEAMTLGLTTIWFSGGAVTALIVEILGGNAYVQIAVFLLISLLLLYFTRPIAVKYFNQNRAKTNADSLIGKRAIVTSAIHNLQESGKVMVDGMEWTARSSHSSESFEKDRIVKIVSIKGVKLIVEADETAHEGGKV